MPYPQDSRNREPSDARAALMAKLPSQFSPYLDGGAARTRYLQAERPRPYLRVPPKQRLLAECRKNRLAPSLGWGAFLKDETLRSPQGEVVRVATWPCPSPSRTTSSCGIKLEFPDRCQPPLVEAHRALRRDCKAAARADSARDCLVPLWILDPETGTQAARRKCSSATNVTCAAAGDSGCETVYPRTILEHGMDIDALGPECLPPWGPKCGPEGMSERLCAKAADEMFSMFIDESCFMEEDYRGLGPILAYSTSL
ncbi:hypothetical protein DFH09DRAFT_147659 [Mycena vulgaris]|nr:hypothetical protein DFH09DRAFT_147659 [Mycena vulgaris]